MDRERDSDNHARKGNRPPGLKGKAIGMYYRDQGRQRAKERGRQNKNGGNPEPEVPKIRMGCGVNVPGGVLEQVKKFMQDFNKTPRKSHTDGDEQFELQFRHLLSVNFHQFIAEKKQENSTLNYINQNLDTKLMEQHRERLQAPNLRERLQAREQLPAMAHAEEIIRTVQQHQVILIVGSTGCGKTTQVPQLLLDHSIVQGRGSDCRIVCTQPRRISAITIAERVSYERGESLGQSVGYQIRLESRKPRDRASITYCTTGVLLQQLQSDPLMHSLSVLILDEIHERSVETDMLMGLLKVILPHRPNLKVILMSATVREQDFCDYFENCPMFRIEGVMFPVRMLYLEDVLSLTNYQFDNNSRGSKRKPRQDRRECVMEHEAMILPYVRRVRHMYDRRVLDQLRLPESEGCEDIDFIADLVYYICEHEPEGAILVFLPGFDKISKLNKALENPQGSVKGQHWRHSLVLYPLHSLMPSVEQQAVFRRPPAGKRKVIMSTIIAETSVTIDDVVYVINSGRTKASNYDIASNIQSLDEVWVSKANTQQRKGRAGRVRPGICYNLFTRAREERMEDIPTPDILRSKLESIILSLKLLHIDNPYDFLGTLISAPEQEAIKNGVLLLMRIGALDKAGILTPLGVHLAKLPVDPQMGKMMLMSALFCCLDPITSAAAALSYKSPFYTPLGQESRVDQVKRRMAHSVRSDHLMVHNTICAYRKSGRSGDRNFCYTNYLSYMTLQQLERMKHQFAELLCNYKFLSSPGLLDKSSNINSEKIPLLRAIIGAGLYPNMAYLRKARRIKNSVRAVHNMSTDDGKRVNFHPSSVNSGESSFDSDYFVYYQRQKSSSLYLLDSTMVFPMALIIFGDGVEAGVADRVPYLCVANTYYFKCNPETAKVVLELRTHLGRLLLKKALYPAPIEEHGEEKQLIKAIELLLSLDEKLDHDSFSSDEIDDI
ncbi:ATP-dependent DNA/RNA helicase DHX36 [Drosophila guanche]|uniref:RNA helicase n=1 Tax=Drosophila guanche TaxID=7266 RepID=A0A3B0JB86_DROGU|nr:ATP-dependent DNA/RNA helicase DHX36 [Drosophila guanche]SPP79617.1 blast:ATP-dependent RNA helicase DHX36 [Drosophila guanche]